MLEMEMKPAELLVDFGKIVLQKKTHNSFLSMKNQRRKIYFSDMYFKSKIEF